MGGSALEQKENEQSFTMEKQPISSIREGEVSGEYFPETSPVTNEKNERGNPVIEIVFADGTKTSNASDSSNRLERVEQSPMAFPSEKISMNKRSAKVALVGKNCLKIYEEMKLKSMEFSMYPEFRVPDMDKENMNVFSQMKEIMKSDEKEIDLWVIDVPFENDFHWGNVEKLDVSGRPDLINVMLVSNKGASAVKRSSDFPEIFYMSPVLSSEELCKWFVAWNGFGMEFEALFTESEKGKKEKFNLFEEVKKKEMSLAKEIGDIRKVLPKETSSKRFWKSTALFLLLFSIAVSFSFAVSIIKYDKFKRVFEKAHEKTIATFPWMYGKVQEKSETMDSDITNSSDKTSSSIVEPNQGENDDF